MSIVQNRIRGRIKNSPFDSGSLFLIKRRKHYCETSNVLYDYGNKVYYKSH